MRLRRRFADVVSRQLDLFAREHGELLAEAAAAERAYDRAGPDEAQERYADYAELVETGAEALAALRDAFAATLDEGTDEEYVATFNRGVLKRFRRYAAEVEGQ